MGYFKSYGTGSCPCPPQGLQLRILFVANQAPLIIPYFFKASKLYVEQVGVYLQLGGVSGEIKVWYILMSNTRGLMSIFFKDQDIKKN